MGTSDGVLPWALKILMITLVTVAVFIYRKPFERLFASVGSSAIGASDRADADLSRAAAGARANTVTAATCAVPGLAGYRAARWARRNPAQAAGVALGAATALGTASVAAGAAAGADGASGGGDGVAGAPGGGSPDPMAAGAASRARARGASAGTSSGDHAPPLRLPTQQGTSANWAHGGPAGSSGTPNGGGRPTGPTSSGAAAAAAGSPPP